jgi:UDP-N-acetylmuramoyl-tripeptide--D-alanyl-D-alanine ligase
VVMTDMLELGPDATIQHAALADAVLDAGAERVFLAGPLMRALWEILPPERRGAYADQAEDLAGPVVGEIRGGDVVMVKGSNGSKAGRIVQALSEAYGGAGEGR